MNPIAIFMNRTAQAFLRVGMLFLVVPKPKVFSQKERFAKALKKKGVLRPLVVTSPGASGSRLYAILEKTLRQQGIEPVVYLGAIPNPNFGAIEAGAGLYHAEGCDAIIGLGGGSAMDCAKGVAIKLAYPNVSLERFKGALKVGRKLTPLFAVPTTVGTGSEATLAAVVVNEANKDKFQIDDPKLVPSYALLDPEFVMGMPFSLIASTGMDALTHAIESYIGRSNTAFTKKEAIAAIRLIDEHLIAFALHPKNEAHARGMQEAAFHAGTAFTRAYVGYVHALAHALGGAYGLPHGYANAVLLPHVLEAYGPAITRKLAELSDALGLAKEGTAQEKADAFLSWVKRLQASLQIPSSFGGIVKEGEYAALAQHAAKEANPFYPVPKLFDARELEEILREADE